MRFRILAASLFCLTISASSAWATLLTVSGSGTFGPTANGDPDYVQNATFSFSFSIDSPLADNPSFDLINASYSVGGVAIATPIVVDFFTPTDGGLFSLGFDDGASLSFFGPDIGSSGSVLPGQFVGAVFGSAQDYGSAAISVSAIPLPPSLLVLSSSVFLHLVATKFSRRSAQARRGRAPNWWA